MLNILITAKGGHQFKATDHDKVLIEWQTLEPSEFLQKYMLANWPVYAKTEQSEELGQSEKVLKDSSGRYVWWEGETTAILEGMSFEVIGYSLPEEIKPFIPHFTDMQLAYIKRLVYDKQKEAFARGKETITAC